MRRLRSSPGGSTGWSRDGSSIALGLEKMRSTLGLRLDGFIDCIRGVYAVGHECFPERELDGGGAVRAVSDAS